MPAGKFFLLLQIFREILLKKLDFFSAKKRVIVIIPRILYLKQILNKFNYFQEIFEFFLIGFSILQVH